MVTGTYRSRRRYVTKRKNERTPRIRRFASHHSLIWWTRFHSTNTTITLSTIVVSCLTSRQTTGNPSKRPTHQAQNYYCHHGSAAHCVSCSSQCFLVTKGTIDYTWISARAGNGGYERMCKKEGAAREPQRTHHKGHALHVYNTRTHRPSPLIGDVTWIVVVVVVISGVAGFVVSSEGAVTSDTTMDSESGGADGPEFSSIASAFAQATLSDGSTGLDMFQWGRKGNTTANCNPVKSGYCHLIIWCASVVLVRLLVN